MSNGNEYGGLSLIAGCNLVYDLSVDSAIILFRKHNPLKIIKSLRYCSIFVDFRHLMFEKTYCSTTWAINRSTSCLNPRVICNSTNIQANPKPSDDLK